MSEATLPPDGFGLEGLDLVKIDTIWLYGVPGSYHDSKCQCPNHCLNCFTDLPEARAQIASMIERKVVGPNGPYTEADQLGPRRRYCCDHCQGQAKYNRALDRAFEAAIRHATQDAGEY
jgi:hypothetical protein